MEPVMTVLPVAAAVTTPDDETVDATVAGHGVGHHRAHGLLVPDLAWTGRGPATRGFDLRGNLRELLRLATHEHDVSAERGQLSCRAAPDATAAANDEDELACEETGGQRGSEAHGTTRAVWPLHSAPPAA